MDLNVSAESTSSHVSSTTNDVSLTFNAEIAKLSEQEQEIYKNRLRRRRQNETSFKIEFGKSLDISFF